MKCKIFFGFLFILFSLNRAYAQIVPPNSPILKIMITSSKPYCFSERGELIILTDSYYQFQTMIGADYYTVGTNWTMNPDLRGNYIYRARLHVATQPASFTLTAQYQQYTASVLITTKASDEFYNTCTNIPRPFKLNWSQAAQLYWQIFKYQLTLP